MIYDKDSVDYQMNLVALEEIENFIPMTKRERQCIRRWVKRGHDPDTNPWNFMDSDGFPLGYLQAFRIQYGYSCGPWDYWKGSEHQPCWCDDLKCFLPKDELY